MWKDSKAENVFARWDCFDIHLFSCSYTENALYDILLSNSNSVEPNYYCSEP